MDKKTESLRMRATLQFKDRLLYLSKYYRLNSMTKVIERLVNDEYERIMAKNNQKSK